MPHSFEVSVAPDSIVTAHLYQTHAPKSLQTTVILGHGAGASQLSPFMTHFARGLASRGADVVTFDFVYMERRRRAPDPPARLEACYRAVVQATRERVPTARVRLVVGGKSMGGRIASQVVAADAGGLDVGGLVFLGYPLHPPGRPDRLRSAHLPSINAPMLFVQGSRDPFGTRDELQPVLSTCRSAQLLVVERGDHSLKVKGNGAPSPEQVWDGVLDRIAAWIRQS